MSAHRAVTLALLVGSLSLPAWADKVTRTVDSQGVPVIKIHGQAKPAAAPAQPTPLVNPRKEFQVYQLDGEGAPPVQPAAQPVPIPAPPPIAPNPAAPGYGYYGSGYYGPGYYGWGYPWYPSYGPVYRPGRHHHRPHYRPTNHQNPPVNYQNPPVNYQNPPVNYQNPPVNYRPRP